VQVARPETVWVAVLVLATDPVARLVGLRCDLGWVLAGVLREVPGTAWPWRSAGGSGMAAMEEHLLMIVEERLQADGADPHDWSLFVVAAR
jgi:hypothetical protein